MKSHYSNLKVNFALSVRKYTVHLQFYLTQLSLLLRAVNKVCLQLSVKDSVVSNIVVGELYISSYLEQNSPLTQGQFCCAHFRFCTISDFCLFLHCHKSCKVCNKVILILRHQQNSQTQNMYLKVRKRGCAVFCTTLLNKCLLCFQFNSQLALSLVIFLENTESKSQS